MRTLYLFLFVLLNIIHIHGMENTTPNPKRYVTHVSDIDKELSNQRLSPRSEKAPQKKYSIICHKNPFLRLPNDIPFLRLPNDSLRKILQYASNDNIFNAVKALTQLGRACKLLRSAYEPNTMKAILNLDQRILDDNLFIYASHHLTPEQDFTHFLKILIAMGAQIKRYESLITCVEHATNSFYVEQYIKQYEPNINIQNSMGGTPLRYTIDLNKPNIMKVLLEHGADINLKNTRGETPASIALLYGHVECIKLLIKHGVDLSIEYDYGHDYKITIAKWAENAKNEEIYKLATGKEIPKKWPEALISFFKR